MRHTAIGVDIGGTNLRAARVSASGEILARRAEPIGRAPGVVLEQIVALCRDLLDPGVRGIGIGVPGRVDARARSVFSGGYLDLVGVPLAGHVEQALGRPVSIDNDCNMALVAEMAAGAARGCGEVAMFTIGTGIGGAIASGGRILRGRATAGQLGHLTVADPGLPCACGRHGCVETASSGTALRRLMIEAGLPPGLTADALFAREAAGDSTARDVLDRWIHPLRAAIDGIVAALDPEIVLLGGGLGGAADRALARAPARSPWYRCPVAAARLGDEAGVIGAALSALAESEAVAGVAR